MLRGNRNDRRVKRFALNNAGLLQMAMLIWFLLIAAPASAAEETFRYDAKGARDPFVPLLSGRGGYASDASEIGSIKDIRLEGIVWDRAEGSVAIINGEIVTEGREMGSVKVLRIQEKSVVFDFAGEEVTVELRE